VENTGWIVFLPVVSAFVGAIIGAWANSLYRNRETKKARGEELLGLLILLYVEVTTNNLVLATFLKERVAQPKIDRRAHVADTLQSAVWDECRVRLAQLRTPRKFLGPVANYYMKIDSMRRDWKVPLGEKVPPGDLSEHDTKRASDIREHGIRIIRAGQDYLGIAESVRPPLDEDLSGHQV
jgi:hypothetical protein